MDESKTFLSSPVCVLSGLVMSHSVTPWTVARQAPLSMGILQARILEWVAMPSSRQSSRPRDRTHVSCSSCIAGGFFTTEQLVKLPYQALPLSKFSISKLLMSLLVIYFISTTSAYKDQQICKLYMVIPN